LLPTGKIAPVSDCYGTVLHGSMPKISHKESDNRLFTTADTKEFRSNKIFQTRMAHPTGTLMGERLQKAFSLQEL